MLDDAERPRSVPPLDVPRARDPHAFGGTAVPIFPIALKDDTGFRRGLDELLDEYDDRCARLAVWYHAALGEQEIWRHMERSRWHACAFRIG